MVDADGASKFADLARLEQALDDLNGRKVCSLLICAKFLSLNVTKSFLLTLRLQLMN